MKITPKMVKELRDKTGVGMMDCKKALEKSEGDMEEAIVHLREKGLSKAAKKSGREAKEGRIFSYVHPGSRLAVMVEINCETEFVARTDDFGELGNNVAMQVAALSPMAIRREDLDRETIQKEKEIYSNQAVQAGKPEEIVDRIVEGKMEKFYQENCLMEQKFVKNDDLTVEELVKTVIGKLGENMVIRRFCRFEVGEE